MVEWDGRWWTVVVVEEVVGEKRRAGKVLQAKICLGGEHCEGASAEYARRREQGTANMVAHRDNRKPMLDTGKDAARKSDADIVFSHFPGGDPTRRSGFLFLRPGGLILFPTGEDQRESVDVCAVGCRQTVERWQRGAFCSSRCATGVVWLWVPGWCLYTTLQLAMRPGMLTTGDALVQGQPNSIYASLTLLCYKLFRCSSE